MKKLLAIIVCLVMVLAMAVPAFASGAVVCLTGNPEVGSTVMVDKGTTLDSAYNYGTSEEYNAFLEGTVVYNWYRDGAYCQTGDSITFTEADAGCTFYCAATLFSDLDLNQMVGTVVSDSFVVEEPYECTLEITQLPNKLTYTAGEKLDMTGLKVRVWTGDGFFDSYNGDKLTYSNKELVTLGEQKIKLAYENGFTIFIVTVVAPEETTEATTEATTEVIEEETFKVVMNTLPVGEGGVITVGPITGANPPVSSEVQVGYTGIGLLGMGIMGFLLIVLICLLAVLIPVLVIVLIIVLIVRSKKKKKAAAMAVQPAAETVEAAEDAQE